METYSTSSGSFTESGYLSTEPCGTPPGYHNNDTGQYTTNNINNTAQTVCTNNQNQCECGPPPKVDKNGIIIRENTKPFTGIEQNCNDSSDVCQVEPVIIRFPAPGDRPPPTCHTDPSTLDPPSSGDPGDHSSQAPGCSGPCGSPGGCLPNIEDCYDTVVTHRSCRNLLVDTEAGCDEFDGGGEMELYYKGNDVVERGIAQRPVMRDKYSMECNMVSLKIFFSICNCRYSFADEALSIYI